MKLQRFTYKEQVTKKDIVNIEKRVDILAGEIAKDKDPLMAKQAVKDQAIQERVDAKLNIKLDEAFRKYSESEQFELMADSTQYRYLQTYNNHIKPVFGKNSVQDYTRGKVQLFLDKKSRGTQRICLAILKNVENWLLKNDIIESNRLQAILKKPAGKKRTSIHDRTLAELLNSLDNNRNVDQAIKMQLLTGCRINEVLRATWDEIDFKNKLWTIPWEHIKTDRKSTI